MRARAGPRRRRARPLRGTDRLPLGPAAPPRRHARRARGAVPALGRARPRERRCGRSTCARGASASCSPPSAAAARRRRDADAWKSARAASGCACRRAGSRASSSRATAAACSCRSRAGCSWSSARAAPCASSRPGARPRRTAHVLARRHEACRACAAGDLCVIDLASGEERTSSRPEGDRVSWGAPEFVAQEEMNRFDGYWWSPDSKWLLVQRTDETDVERMRIADPTARAGRREFAYPRPGARTPSCAGGRCRPPAARRRGSSGTARAYPYLCAVAWPEARAARRSSSWTAPADRGGRCWRCDAGDGRHAHAARASATRRGSTCDPGDAARGSPTAATFLWIAERDDSGPWLEARAPATAAGAADAAGPARAATLLGVDEATGVAWRRGDTTTRRGAPLARVAQGPPRARAAGRATRACTRRSRARTGGRACARCGPSAGPPRWEVVDAGGRLAGASCARWPSCRPRAGRRVRDRGTRFAARVHRPAARLRPGRRYPVVDWAYGGPHAPRRRARRSATCCSSGSPTRASSWSRVDGRGTPGRGRAWERAIRGDLIGPALADHVRGRCASCERYPRWTPERDRA